jgi:hypothetical protein
MGCLDIGPKLVSGCQGEPVASCRRALRLGRRQSGRERWRKQADQTAMDRWADSETDRWFWVFAAVGVGLPTMVLIWLFLNPEGW